jgi:hypothetical protein
VPVFGIGAPPLDRCQPSEPLGEHDVCGPLQLGVALLEAVVVEPVRILGLDLLERRPEHAHAIHASERVFPIP